MHDIPLENVYRYYQELRIKYLYSFIKIITKVQR